MRKGILGLLAFGWIGLQCAHGQTDYQEPLPVQSAGVRTSVGFVPAGPSRYPNYAPAYPSYAPAPGYTFAAPPGGYWPAPNYPVPPGYRPGAAAFAPPSPAYAPPPNTPQQAAFLPAVDGRAPYAVVPAAAQDLTPPPPGQPEQIQAPKLASQPESPSVVASEPYVVDSGAPPEPPEPYMAAPVSDWRPHKGSRFYGTAEYLYWQTKAPPLVSTLSLSLAAPKTVPTLSDENLNGGRFSLGLWINDSRDWALEGNYFFLQTGGTFNSLTFPPTKLTVKPIFDGIISESSVVSSSTSFSGAELNGRYHLCNLDCFFGTVLRLDFLGGFRFVDLSENLTITGKSAFGTAPVLLSDTSVINTDSFGTHNHLFAGQFGVDTGISWWRLSLDAYGKLAMGDNVQSVHINGITQVAGPPVVGNFTTPGGFFAQPSNIGGYQRHEFAMLPEVGLNLGFHIFEHCRLGVGYTYTYFYHVVRPGDQFDPATAGAAARPPLFFVGGPRPQPLFNNFNETNFWAQGISFTVEVNY